MEYIEKIDINNESYELKENISLDDIHFTDDFWYDLFDGGYIEPESILKNTEQINKINDAIATLNNFKEMYEALLHYIDETQINEEE